MDFITGNKFKDLAKWHYAPEFGQGIRVKNTFTQNHYCYLENTFDKSKVRDGDIVYTTTFFADSLIEELKDFDKRIVVITHNCDTNMDFSPPECVIKWFSQNVNIIHNKVESIPIGLENDIWFPAINKKAQMVEKLKQPRNYRNLVYMNHDVNTFPTERVCIYDLLQDKPWVTTIRGVNGKGFDEYLDNLYNHKYIIVPRGNGIDTHRLWEALYMGTIPIVKKDINNWYYNDLPILYVHKWEDINKELLDDIWDTYYYGDWNKEILTFEYWKNIIYGLEN